MTKTSFVFLGDSRERHGAKPNRFPLKSFFHSHKRILKQRDTSETFDFFFLDVACWKKNVYFWHYGPYPGCTDRHCRVWDKKKTFMVGSGWTGSAWISSSRVLIIWPKNFCSRNHIKNMNSFRDISLFGNPCMTVKTSFRLQAHCVSLRLTRNSLREWLNLFLSEATDSEEKIET